MQIPSNQSSLEWPQKDLRTRNITFKIANLEDTKVLNDIVNSAYRGESSKLGWTTEAHLLDGQRTDEQMLSQMIQDPQGLILLFYVDDSKQPVGCINLIKKDYAKSEDGQQLPYRAVGYFGMFTTVPSLQGLGLGDRFLSIAEEYVRSKWGSTKIWMTVITSRHELIAWYKRRGYNETGIIIDFPKDPRFGIPKDSVDKIKLEIFEKSFD